MLADLLCMLSAMNVKPSLKRTAKTTADLPDTSLMASKAHSIASEVSYRPRPSRLLHLITDRVGT